MVENRLKCVRIHAMFTLLIFPLLTTLQHNCARLGQVDDLFLPLLFTSLSQFRVSMVVASQEGVLSTHVVLRRTNTASIPHSIPN